MMKMIRFEYSAFSRQRQWLVLMVIVALWPAGAVLGGDPPFSENFVYQGRLEQSGVPADGMFDFRFELYRGAGSANSAGGPVFVDAVNVTEGVFTAEVPLGFAIDGTDLWLEVAVQGPSDPDYTVLAPRHRLQATPHAVFAAALDHPIGAGEVDESDIQLRVDDSCLPGQAMRVIDNSGGVICETAGGSQWTQVTSGIRYIGGNVGIGTLSPDAPLSVAGSAQFGNPSNQATGSRSFASGGGTGSGGNVASGNNSFVAGGIANNAAGTNSIVAGGNSNSAIELRSFVGGGSTNTAAGSNSFVGGGQDNTAESNHSFVGGGLSNNATHSRSFVGGGFSNTASGFDGFVGGGIDNMVDGNKAFIGGGESNAAATANSFIGGGTGNMVVTGGSGFVGGGTGNMVSGFGGFVGGGRDNIASGSESFVGGGRDNTANGLLSFAAGRRAKANHTGTFVWADSTNADFASTGQDQFIVRATGGVGFGDTPSDYFVIDTPFGTQDDDYSFGTGALRVRIGGATRFRVLGNGGVAVGSSYQTSGVPERGMRVSGLVELATLGTGGTTSLCRNGDGAISTCSSSSRYKHDIVTLEDAGMLIDQLRPVRFRWNGSEIEDFGLVAEEVAAIEPRLAIWNADGEVEGVKYRQLAALLAAGLQEQQAQLSQVEDELAQLRRELAQLRHAFERTGW